MYYFNLNDDDTVVDTDGTDLPDVGAARIHATGVARELTSSCQCRTSMAPNCFHSPCRISGMGMQEGRWIGHG
jgi:hypothetical protein